MSAEKREELRAKLAEHSGELIDAVIDSLAAAGGVGQWDSGTIEGVIAPLQDKLEEWGIPIVGEAGLEDENWKYWAELGGYDYDGEYPDDEPEEEQVFSIHAVYVHLDNAVVTRAKYGDGSLALVAEAHDEEGMLERETLSVNLSAYLVELDDGEIYVKNYAEHEGLADALVTAGIATYVGTSEDDARVVFGPHDTTAYRMRVSEEIL